ncbi:hypothetical protein HYT84_02945, partial [Candidatus Micrarchaeota archaeon]|nr:hypothetical protein [Candidatus Micrarchaeota archaeon]
FQDEEAQGRAEAFARVNLPRSVIEFGSGMLFTDTKQVYIQGSAEWDASSWFGLTANVLGSVSTDDRELGTAFQVGVIIAPWGRGKAEFRLQYKNAFGDPSSIFPQRFNATIKLGE